MYLDNIEIKIINQFYLLTGISLDDMVNNKTILQCFKLWAQQEKSD